MSATEIQTAAEPAAPSGPRPGWVYCTVNPSIPGKVKIGFTTQSVEERLAQLDTTGVPTSFELVAKWLSPDCRRDERRVHRALRAYRTRDNREFFDMAPDLAAARIDEILEAQPGELVYRVREVRKITYRRSRHEKSGKPDARNILKGRFQKFLVWYSAMGAILFFGGALLSSSTGAAFYPFAVWLALAPLFYPAQVVRVLRQVLKKRR